LFYCGLFLSIISSRRSTFNAPGLGLCRAPYGVIPRYTARGGTRDERLGLRTGLGPKKLWQVGPPGGGLLGRVYFIKTLRLIVITGSPAFCGPVHRGFPDHSPARRHLTRFACVMSERRGIKYGRNLYKSCGVIWWF